MIKGRFRLSLSHQFVVVGGLLLAIIVGMYYWGLSYQLSRWASPNDVVARLTQLSVQETWIVLAGLMAGATVLAMLYWRLSVWLNRLNRFLDAMVHSKSFHQLLPETSTNDQMGTITRNINTVVGFFRRYNLLKSSRVFVEVNSIKALMNTVSVGVIFVNEDHVVTHINHQAEALFRLMPSEIIGEAISRYIPHEDLLEHLNTALMNDQKVTDVALNLRESETAQLTILPIKNKLGELERAIIILE